MCTGFVRRGNDVIVGFNMDIDPGAFSYRVYAEPDRFYVGMECRELEDALTAIPGASEIYHLDDHVRKIHGVNRNGNFGNQLNNMDFHKAPFRLAPDAVSIDQLMDDYISARISFDRLRAAVETKEVTQIPTGAVDMPTIAFHSIIADKNGRIMILEPGNGYSMITEKYAVLSNFSLLELPGDLTQEKFGYYGKDRYDTAMNMLRESGDDFSAADGLAVLKAVRQTGNWATRVSFVYSNNESTVYYCLDGDFENICVHHFEAEKY